LANISKKKNKTLERGKYEKAEKSAKAVWK